MNRILNRLSSLFLLCLGVCCLTALIGSSFSLLFSPSLWLWLLGSCVLLWIAASFRRGILVGMPLAALLLYGATRVLGANPVAQLNDLLDRVTGAFFTHVTNPGAPYGYINSVSSHSLVLLYLGFLIAAVLAVSLNSRGARISLSLLATLPAFGACVIVNGALPALPAAGMLLFWFLLVLSGGSFQKDGNTGRTVLCCLIPVSLLLGGILALHRPEDYVYTEYDIQLSKRLDRLADYFDLLTGGSRNAEVHASDPDNPDATDAPRSSFQSAWDAEDNSMRLTQEYDSSRTEMRVLQVKAETSGRMHLRIQSYGDYTGTGWLPAEELSAGSSLPFTAFAASASPDGVKRELEIRTYLDLAGLCLPYYAAVSSGSDVVVTAESQESYRVSYTDYRGDPGDLRLPTESAASEQSYQAHAHSVYTRLPDATRDAALQLCRSAGLSAGQADLIPAVAEYVRQSAVYDLQTAPYPSDDYAIYFLTQAHRGYCIHYATAAAVLYRALGIPARVTEGFLVDTHAGQFIDVTAGDAHAWVEVYLDGLGWVPVEVTGANGYATVEPSPTPAPTEIPQESTPAPNEEGGSSSPSGTPTPSPEPLPSDAPQTPPDQQEHHKPFPWRVLWIVLAGLLLLPLWYGLIRAVRLTGLRNQDGRKAVIACWRYAGKVTSYGAELPPIIEHTAEKAAFSPHTIRREEVNECQAALDQMIASLYPGLRPLQKFRFRFLQGLK